MAKKIGRPRKLRPSGPRKIVLDALRGGCSLDDAAGLAGMCYETLNRERHRDPEFDAAVKLAEFQGKTTNIKRVQQAGEKDWRAAAFLLERKYYREFARRNPESLSLQSVVGVVSRLFTRWLGKIPQEQHVGLLADLESTLDELRLAAGGNGDV